MESLKDMMSCMNSWGQRKIKRNFINWLMLEKNDPRVLKCMMKE